MHKYRLISKKGEGTFSEVLKAQSIKNGKYLAIKCMKNHFDSIEQVNNLREIQALRRLSPHEYIIKLYEVLYDQPTGRLALVFELMDMNIYEQIRGRRHYLQETVVKTYLWQLVMAMDHMHRNGIFHRDVKPENILIAEENLKVADYGSCRGIYSKQPYTEYISTRWYRAPECLLTDGYYGYKMDLWGVGCVMFEIIALFPLFPGTNELDQIQKIHSVLGTPSPEILAKFRKYATHIDFNFPPKEGTGIRKLIPHVSDDCHDLIEKLLAYDPEERLSARQALRHPWFKEKRDVQHRKEASNESRRRAKDDGRSHRSKDDKARRERRHREKEKDRARREREKERERRHREKEKARRAAAAQELKSTDTSSEKKQEKDRSSKPRVIVGDGGESKSIKDKGSMKNTTKSNTKSSTKGSTSKSHDKRNKGDPTAGVGTGKSNMGSKSKDARASDNSGLPIIKDSGQRRGGAGSDHQVTSNTSPSKYLNTSTKSSKSFESSGSHSHTHSHGHSHAHGSGHGGHSHSHKYSKSNPKSNDYSHYESKVSHWDHGKGGGTHGHNSQNLGSGKNNMFISNSHHGRRKGSKHHKHHYGDSSSINVSSHLKFSGSKRRQPAHSGALPPISIPRLKGMKSDTHGSYGGEHKPRYHKSKDHHHHHHQHRSKARGAYQLGQGFSKSKVKSSVYHHYYPNAKSKRRKDQYLHQSKGDRVYQPKSHHSYMKKGHLSFHNRSNQGHYSTGLVSLGQQSQSRRQVEYDSNGRRQAHGHHQDYMSPYSQKKMLQKQSQRYR